ncbi:DEAD-box ATP-dependent RNA helicase 31 isoform X2 [Panicum hallii]|uniref:DEAD-box ATP-dependent RNA helicase 31 isoform X2 n=1 Tax=Panicum hallii TaxID=206008 RepID=UPI000DF4EA3A|nr:DEAD-box ATP-dependent RNA helicase 31 isoform X2 [Panicum hallii]
MRRHHHILALLRRAAASTSTASQRADPLLYHNPAPPRNGAAVLFSTRLFSSRGRSVAGAAKSLVEDEADLSDWISDLKTDSFHLGLSSGDEGDAPSTRRPPTGASRGGRGGRDSRGSFSRSRFGGGEFGGDRRGGFERRGRVMSSDLDDDEDDSGFGSSRGRRGRGGRSSGLAMRGGRGNGFDDEAGFRSPRGQRGRGGRGSGVARRGGSYSDLDDGDAGFGPSRGRQGRGGRMSGFSQRRGRGSDDSEEDDDDAVGFGRSERMQHRGGRRGGRAESVGPHQGWSRSDLGDNDDDRDIGFGSSRGRRGCGGRMSGVSQRRGRESDLDDDEDDDDDDDVVGFGDSGARGVKKFDFGLSEDDDEVGKVDEDDDPSGFEDDLFDDEGGKESGSFKLDKEEEVKHKSIAGTRSTGGSDSYLSQKRFDECPLSPLTLRGVKAAGYERMTAVQEATLPIILQGKDVLAKARTGTGKTVAFLLPAIEVVSKLPPVDRDQKRPPISVVVVCPTRELADQAAAEANKLLKFHPSIGVQLVIGGTRMALEQKRMHTNPCQILVATPGRLRDHMENTPGFATRLMGVKVLILDEADRLLDMGFRSDIEKIVAALPKQRQTLLFSATVPDEVRQVCHIAMKRDLEFVNTVQEGSEETHSQVKQMHLIAPLDKQFSILYGLLTDHISENVDYKVIVFCTTAKVTSLVAELLSELKLNVREIHSRKPQSYRTRISKEFKESKGLILVSSDVSARGVDYPNVTLVVQLGVPTDREQYIHRLGRTGRKGNDGAGVLLLAPWEEYFLRSIKDLPVTEATQPLIDLDTKKKVDKALAHVEVKDKESAYQAWLGYYNSNKFIGRDKYQLVSLANEFSRSMGLNNPPAVPKLVLRKMSLNNIPGLRAK